MRAPLTIADMQANVARSREHVVSQEAIIARLIEQGHEAMVASAHALLVTMKGHLAVEVDMLARMEATTPKPA